MVYCIYFLDKLCIKKRIKLKKKLKGGELYIFFIFYYYFYYSSLYNDGLFCLVVGCLFSFSCVASKFPKSIAKMYISTPIISKYEGTKYNIPFICGMIHNIMTIAAIAIIFLFFTFGYFTSDTISIDTIIKSIISM